MVDGLSEIHVLPVFCWLLVVVEVFPKIHSVALAVLMLLL